MHPRQQEKIILAVMSLVCPPLGVMHKGCGIALLAGILWIFGWIPGVILAWYIIFKDDSDEKLWPRYVQVPMGDSSVDEKPKRKGAFTRLADGEIVEVMEDDNAPLEDFEKRKRGKT